MHSRMGLFFRGRINVLLFLYFICFLMLIVTLWYLQVKNGDYYYNLSRNNRIRRVRLPAPRGKILDRNGQILVDNRPSYNVMIDLEAVGDVEPVVMKISDLLGVEKSEIIKNIKSKNRFPYMPAVVLKDIDLSKVMLIEEHLSELPGIFMAVEPIRNYRYGQTASHVFGYVGKIDPKELDRLKDYGYHYRDYIGKAGIELQYDIYLRGKAGGMQVQVDNRGRLDRILSEKKPVLGNNILLTIDLKTQLILEDVYKEHTGAAVVVKSHTGEILAMVSNPSFDPNIFIDPKKKKEVLSLLKDKRHPLVNKTIMAEFAPGSIYKIVVAAAALENKVINMETAFHCEGTFQLGMASFKCWWEPGHRWVNILDALKFSCNVFFYNVGLKLNHEFLAKIALDFGLGQKLGIDLPGEKKGLIPTPAWKKKRFGEPWYGGDTVNIAIGQGYVLVTPLQIVMMMNLLANEGKLLQPYLLYKIESPSGSYVIKTEKKEISATAINNTTMNLIREGIYNVVNAERGTGKRAALKSVKVSGKTGTIQVKKRDEELIHAWFTGYASDKNDEITFVFFIENAESGGRTAAPLAQKFLAKYFDVEEEITIKKEEL